MKLEKLLFPETFYWPSSTVECDGFVGERSYQEPCLESASASSPGRSEDRDSSTFCFSTPYRDLVSKQRHDRKSFKEHGVFVCILEPGIGKQIPVFGVGSTPAFAEKALSMMLEMHYRTLVEEGGILSASADEFRRYLLSEWTITERRNEHAHFRSKHPVDKLVIERWCNFSEGVFAHLAQYACKRLGDLIKANVLRARHMSYACQLFGNNSSAHDALSILADFLDDSNPLVREGVVLGLASHVDVENVNRLLQKRLSDDSSEAVKSAIRDVLEG